MNKLMAIVVALFLAAVGAFALALRTDPVAEPRLALADQMDAYETVAGKEAATVGLRLARPHLSREAVAYFDARLTALGGSRGTCLSHDDSCGQFVFDLAVHFRREADGMANPKEKSKYEDRVPIQVLSTFFVTLNNLALLLDDEVGRASSLDDLARVRRDFETVKEQMEAALAPYRERLEEPE